ncbi:MAG TPA: MerR family transcriptional regulator [Bryobacteraceae bacterium]|nr:MerR family transcriptional regulator [Bryobacteraceae bacterium]
MEKKGIRVARLYRVQEFASLAGVTVRALHHYDRLGLLRPRRTDSGYRLYRLTDLERLEQIVALKCLEIPLKQIKILLDRDGLEISDALRCQRRVLESKRRLMDRAIAAIRDAEKAIPPGKRADAAVLKKIIEVIEMQNNTDWMKKYSTGEAWAKIEERKKLWSPELQERVSKQWTGLFHDVEAALGEDPAGKKAQALAARWKKLVEGFTGGDPDITTSLRNLYADRANWSAEFHEQMAPFSNPKVWEFMRKAMACAGE